MAHQPFAREARRQQRCGPLRAAKARASPPPNNFIRELASCRTSGPRLAARETGARPAAVQLWRPPSSTVCLASSLAAPPIPQLQTSNCLQHHQDPFVDQALLEQSSCQRAAANCLSATSRRGFVPARGQLRAALPRRFPFSALSLHATHPASISHPAPATPGPVTPHHPSWRSAAGDCAHRAAMRASRQPTTTAAMIILCHATPASLRARPRLQHAQSSVVCYTACLRKRPAIAPEHGPRLAGQAAGTRRMRLAAGGCGGSITQAVLSRARVYVRRGRRQGLSRARQPAARPAACKPGGCQRPHRGRGFAGLRLPFRGG